MWIVALALRRPYTFIVMALVISLLTPLTILRTPTDIFPDINIPVVSVIWFYTGLSPNEMANRMITNCERGLTLTVNDIEHTESQSLNGIGIIKVFFRPQANIQTALVPGHEHSPDQAEADAARCDAPAGGELYGVFHAGHPTWTEQQNHPGARSLRPRARTSCALISPPCKVRLRRTHTAARFGRCRWIWTCRGCRPKGSRRSMS